MSTCSAESLLSVIVALHRAKVPGDQQPELSVHTQPLATRGSRWTSQNAGETTRQPVSTSLVWLG